LPKKSKTKIIHYLIKTNASVTPNSVKLAAGGIQH